MKRYRLLIVIFAGLLLCGCGYTTGSLLPSHIKTIYVENFESKIDISAEPSDKEGYKIYIANLENDITARLIDQFIFDGHLHIVDKEDAGLILTGELIDYYKQPLRYDRFDNVEEYRTVITVDFVVKDVAKNKILRKENGFIGYDTYRLTGQLASTEEDARNGAIKDLVEKIVEKVIEGW